MGSAGLGSPSAPQLGFIVKDLDGSLHSSWSCGFGELFYSPALSPS